MSQFRFRLQSVQKLRERLRDEAADSLRQARLAIQKLNEQVDVLQQEMGEQQKLQSGASEGVINTQRVLESQRYQLHLTGEILALKENISLIEQECERRQQLLIKREQDVRALEKLKEAQLAQWQHEQNLAQQSRLDEWASFRFWKQAQVDEASGSLNSDEVDARSQR
ncbi:MAG: flagellar export protein FliJ [Pirellulales bacterium]